MQGYYFGVGQVDDDQDGRPRPPPPPPPRPLPPPPPPAPAPPPKKKKGGLGKILGSIGRVALTVAPVVAMALGDSLTGQDASTATPVGVNPMWVRLAQVLNEVSAGFRMTGVPLRSDQQTFLRVVEHLAQVVNGLALAPNDPALLAEYQELTDFLEAHPDSVHLGEFIATHPKIVPMVVPAQTASTGYFYG